MMVHNTGVVANSGGGGGYENVPIPRKLKPPSPAYDRFPKPMGGVMKVFPITTPDRDEPMVSTS